MERGFPGLGDTGSARHWGPEGMKAREPARLPQVALGWWGRWRRQRRWPLGTSLCAGPRAAASRPHPRPGRQAPGAGRNEEDPGLLRRAGVLRGRRLGPGSPVPEEGPAPATAAARTAAKPKPSPPPPPPLPLPLQRHTSPGRPRRAALPAARTRRTLCNPTPPMLLPSSATPEPHARLAGVLWAFRGSPGTRG